MAEPLGAAALEGRLRELAAAKRLVFLAGLPGTRKSFFVNRLAHLAHAAGRTVSLLQWDVARPVFEGTPTGRRYPIAGGVTHPVIRKAAGMWVRHALAQWESLHPEPAHLLIGETPIAGNRFVELARRADDAAEPLLAAASCLFVVPVPSVGVRQFLEAERSRRTKAAVHDRERQDAPPNVLRELWEELATVARRLGGLSASGEQAGSGTYDPVAYERVYRYVLRHRATEVLAVTQVTPGAPASAHAFAVSTADLVPAQDEAAACIAAVEARYPDLRELEGEVNRWSVV